MTTELEFQERAKKYRLKSDHKETCYALPYIGEGLWRSYEIRWNGRWFTAPHEMFEPLWEPVGEDENTEPIEDELERLERQWTGESRWEIEPQVKSAMARGAQEIRKLRGHLEKAYSARDVATAHAKKLEGQKASLDWESRVHDLTLEVQRLQKEADDVYKEVPQDSRGPSLVESVRGLNASRVRAWDINKELESAMAQKQKDDATLHDALRQHNKDLSDRLTRISGIVMEGTRR